MKLKWVREIEKWKINRDLTVGYAEGSTFPDTDIVVINYDIAQKNIDKIRTINWDLVITDEAHNLKNPEAQRTQAILGDLDSFEGLGPIPMNKNGQLVHLTGTPKPNRVAELWPLLTSSRPDIWGRGPEARQAFLNRYEPPILIQREVQSKFKGGKPRKIIVPMPGKPIRELELQMRMGSRGTLHSADYRRVVEAACEPGPHGQLDMEMDEVYAAVRYHMAAKEKWPQISWVSRTSSAPP